MFGVYSNRRLSENERKILHLHPDDYNWYCVVLNALFDDRRFFQVREDIKLPQEGDDGVVLIFEGGDVVYFNDVEVIDDESFEAIVEACAFLEEKFDRPIDAYIVCPPKKRFCVENKSGKGNVRIFLSSFVCDNGEEVIERLEAKLDNNEDFTISDSTDHMLLPYMGYRDKEEFQKKFQGYMKKIDGCAALKQVDL